MGSWGPLHWLFVLAIGYVVWRYIKSNISPSGGAPTRSTTRPQYTWPSESYFDFDIVGESNYQRALKLLAGEHDDKGVAKEVAAVLHLEDENKHDNKAVRVDIDGYTVGYLSREDARSYRRRLSTKKLGKIDASCTAQIMGGHVMKDGSTAHYGVRLAIKPFR